MGIDSNFFELGGHSLKATVMVSGIHKAFNVKVPLTGIFMNPTLRELSSAYWGLKKRDIYIDRAGGKKGLLSFIPGPETVIYSTADGTGEYCL